MSQLRLIASQLNLLHQESFLAFLSDSDLNKLESVDDAESKEVIIFDPRKPLELLHPSWLKKRIEDLPENKRSFFAPIQEKILAPGALPEDMRILLLGELFSSAEDHVLPNRKHAEESPLAFLLGKPKEFFEMLFICMGCHFLAETLRKVISKKELDRVMSALDPVSKPYLRKRLFDPKKMSVEALDIKVISTTPQELRETLIRQGKDIFQKIILAQDDAFRWYFMRGFDVDYSESLMSLGTEQELALSPESIKVWTKTMHSIEQYLQQSGVS